MANQIIHAEVTGRDAPALQRFFGDLFDWKMNTDLPGGYGIAEKAGGGIDFGSGPTQDGSAGWVTFYVKVPDINATLAKVTKLGGAVVMPRFSPAPDTYLALFADPEGHVVGLTEGM